MQVCKTYHAKGLRSDVCLRPDLSLRRTYGLRDPVDGHRCEPKCASCGAVHITGDRSCQRRLKRPKPPQDRQRIDKPKDVTECPRWFFSEDEESELAERQDSQPRDQPEKARPQYPRQ
ncbi:hypothetical protein MTO96_031027 [Rhipicephalus appendiculatus]